MADGPMATDSKDAVYYLETRSVLRPEDLLSDPAGETVFLPSAEALSGLFPSRAPKAAAWDWPGFPF